MIKRNNLLIIKNSKQHARTTGHDNIIESLLAGEGMGGGGGGEGETCACLYSVQVV